MPVISMRFRRWIFQPTWPWTLLVVAACCAFIALGRWQWNRGELRHAQWEQFAHESGPAAPLDARTLDSVPRFERVSVTGVADAHRQLLLDNRVQDGVAGFDVLMPVELSDHRFLLIDRGWVPLTGSRSHLPDVAVSVPALVTLSGRIDNLPVAGLELGRAAPVVTDPWPKLTSFPSADQLDAAYGRHVERHLLLLDADQPFGFTRRWEPPGLPPEQHWGYAFQWWSFAILAVVLWFYTALR